MKKKSLFVLAELFSTFIIILIAYALFVYGNIKLGSDTTISSATDSSSSIYTPSTNIVTITPESFLKMQDTFSKITIINFWNSSCLSCKKEIPLLRKFARSNNYQLIYINTETNYEGNKESVKASMANFGISKSYVIAQNNAGFHSGEALLKDFLEGINVKDYQGSPQFTVVYNPEKKSISSFSGFDIDKVFNKFMETKINFVSH